MKNDLITVFGYAEKTVAVAGIAYVYRPSDVEGFRNAEYKFSSGRDLSANDAFDPYEEAICLGDLSSITYDCKIELHEDLYRAIGNLLVKLLLTLWFDE